jgi:hypothetical protein
MTATNEDIEAVAREMSAAALVVLTRLGIPSDVQGLLCYGDDRGTVAPQALTKAMEVVLRDLRARGWQKVPEGSAKDVLEERKRQISQEGWTPEHDNTHKHGELAMAAALYASPRVGLCIPVVNNDGVSFDDPWPWWKDTKATGRSSTYRARAWWKPKDRRRDLVRAAALILAEIERLDRAMIGAKEG